MTRSSNIKPFPGARAVPQTPNALAEASTAALAAELRRRETDAVQYLAACLAQVCEAADAVTALPGVPFGIRDEAARQSEGAAGAVDRILRLERETRRDRQKGQRK